MELQRDVSEASDGAVWPSYFLAGVGIEQDPPKLDDLGRVFCNIYAMLVTGCSNMDHHVSIQIIRFLRGLVLQLRRILG